MRMIRDYYLIEPKDSLDEIKYLINLGCMVLGYFKIGKFAFTNLFLISYSRFGAPIENIEFKKYRDNDFDGYDYYYVKW